MYQCCVLLFVLLPPAGHKDLFTLSGTDRSEFGLFFCGMKKTSYRPHISLLFSLSSPFSLPLSIRVLTLCFVALSALSLVWSWSNWSSDFPNRPISSAYNYKSLSVCPPSSALISVCDRLLSMAHFHLSGLCRLETASFNGTSKDTKLCVSLLSPHYPDVYFMFHHSQALQQIREGLCRLPHLPPQKKERRR